MALPLVEEPKISSPMISSTMVRGPQLGNVHESQAWTPRTAIALPTGQHVQVHSHRRFCSLGDFRNPVSLRAFKLLNFLGES